MSLVLLFNQGGTPTVAASGHGRNHSRGSATVLVIEIVSAHGRAHSRASATGEITGVTTAAAHGHAHSRGTAVRSLATVAVSVQGWGRGRSAGYGEVPGGVVTVTASGAGKGRGRTKTVGRMVTITVAQGRAKGYGSAFGDRAGIQYVTANSIDVLDFLMPLSPSRYASIAVSRSRRPVSALGKVVHTIIAPSGESSNPVIGEWSSEDELFGGFAAATGVLGIDEFRRHRGVYIAGAVWRTFHVETGECVWAGRLMEPDMHQGGTVGLTGRGWGQVILNRPQRRTILYAHYGAEGWVDANQEIGNFTADAEGHWDLSMSGGSITFKRTKDPDRTYPDGLNRTAHFTSPGAQLSRLQFWLEATRTSGGTVSFDVSVGSGRIERFDDNGNLFFNYVREVTIPTDAGVKYNVEYDVDLTQDNTVEGITEDWQYRSPIDFITVSINSNSTGVTEGLNVRIKDIRVLGESLTENEMSAGQLVSDLCNRMSLATNFIDNAGPDILPYEIPAGTLVSDVFAFITLLSGRRFVVRGERPIAYFSPPANRQWVVTEEHHEQDLVPAERFDTILIPWRASTDSELRGFRQVQLEHSPLERHNNFGALDWPFPIRFRQTSGSPFGADDQRAEDLGVRLLHVLSKNRRSGQGRVTEVVDQNGIRQSARLVQAGDSLRYARGEYVGQLLVTKVRQSDNAVDLEYDNPAALYIDRQRAQVELKHSKRLG